jgi:ribosomal protein L31
MRRPWPTGSCHAKNKYQYLTRVCTVRKALLKPDGTRAETRFRLSPKWTSPFKTAGVSVQSTAGSRDVRVSVSNAGYTMFGGRVRVLATHSISQFPLHFTSRASPCAIRFQTRYTTDTDSLGRGGGTEGLCMSPVGNTAPFNPFGHCLLVIYEGTSNIVPIPVAAKSYAYAGSAATRLLGSRVRIPLKPWLFLSCVGCVLCM